MEAWTAAQGGTLARSSPRLRSQHCKVTRPAMSPKVYQTPRSFVAFKVLGDLAPVYLPACSATHHHTGSTGHWTGWEFC